MKDKETIMNDMTFRHRCSEFGVSWEEFTVFGREGNIPLTIVIPTKDEDVYVLMDEDYNVVGVHRFEEEDDRSLLKMASECRSLYDYVYVFYSLRIKDIVDIANRVSISSINHGNSLRMYVNGENVDTNYGETYIELLCTIKFFGDKIKEYFKELYKSKMLRLDYPSITTYFFSLRNCFDKCITKAIKDNERPFPIDILYYIGDDNSNIEYYNMSLFGLIEFLLHEKGYKIGNGYNYDKLELSDESKDDIFNKTEDLLRILDVSNEEVEERYKRSEKEVYKVNLEEIFSGTVKKHIK